MSDVIRIDTNPAGVPVPVELPQPRSQQDITIRPAMASDYPFIDALQKANSKAVGFMWEKAIKGHLSKGNVLVAVATGTVNSSPCSVNSGDADSTVDCSLGTDHSTGSPVGYLIAVDRYLKRDELGIIYQMNVVPEWRRSLVAANLLKAKFEASAYGCRLYCCWCAQDLEANHFWEAMGFVPLAFRTGGGRKRKAGPRMHIFWQKRIREGDTGDPASGGTPYWFPSQTGAGAIGEDRLVLPIPPGTHWSDAKPIVLPNGPAPGSEATKDEVLLLESEVQRLERERKQRVKQKKDAALKLATKSEATQRTVKRGGLRFGAPMPSPAAKEAEQQAEAAVDAELKQAKKAVKAAKKKFDPAQEAFARELKDRWLEHVATDPGLLLPIPKYDVCRQIEATGFTGSANGRGQRDLIEPKRLDAA
ncbi:hypothetical protein [Algisphaera agarilytica]|uniref:N-acetyltransferase domain-containing protein n=1 Tax=Algisphaera agarilytica TaxID=1385975 RepID=A0A7X0H6Z3_9BACT|nr:hypothetical protein [Algisphaera agarilytica]MBB6428979.1 hypothetical protein [Algisphaera agarilytica]